MQIGKLDQWVTIQQPSEMNDMGSLTKSFSTIATVRARVISERGTEAFESARINAKERIRVLIRDRTDINSKWRIVWLGQNYNVMIVDRSERRDGKLWFTAEAVGAL